uniref:Uncharacterized protein n=1 Tax=Anguilla anguilla TaxID=7936 RepID=A0A0E9V9P5_ANGAN
MGKEKIQVGTKTFYFVSVFIFSLVPLILDYFSHFYTLTILLVFTLMCFGLSLLLVVWF